MPVTTMRKTRKIQPRAGILSDKRIEEAMNDGYLDIDPFEKDCLQSASYDLRFGDIAVITSVQEKINLKKQRTLDLDPYAMAVVETLESLRLSDDIAGRIGAKTDLLRRGILVSAGPQIDPGFRGPLRVNLINFGARPYQIRHGDPFLTIEFHQLPDAAVRPYQGENIDRRLEHEPIEVLLQAYRGTSLSDIYHSFEDLKVKWTGQAGKLIELLERRIAEVEDGRIQSTQMEMHSLGVSGYQLLKPIPVILRRDGDDYTASFYDANIHNSGDTDQEAFDNLRELVLDLLALLKDEETSMLGPEPRRQLTVLQEFIRKVE